MIVDTARARSASVTAATCKMTLSTDLAGDLPQTEDGIVRVHEALQELEQADPGGPDGEMRYFGGWGDKEIAEALDITERTVQRDWEKAKMLLRVILSPDPS